jgi:hypothetical protein
MHLQPLCLPGPSKARDRESEPTRRVDQKAKEQLPREPPQNPTFEEGGGFGDGEGKLIFPHKIVDFCVGKRAEGFFSIIAITGDAMGKKGKYH